MKKKNDIRQTIHYDKSSIGIKGKGAKSYDYKNPLCLRLKKDILIPRGTVLESDGCTKVEYFRPSEDVSHIIAFGKNAVGTLHIGTEIGDEGFDKWFEVVAR